MQMCHSKKKTKEQKKKRTDDVQQTSVTISTIASQRNLNITREIPSNATKTKWKRKKSKVNVTTVTKDIPNVLTNTQHPRNKVAYSYTETESNWCKEKKSLIGTDVEDIYTLVDIHLLSTVTLACHYCDEYDDENPKVWYKKSRDPQEREKEIETVYRNKLSDNRIFIMPDHTLVIQNVSELDNGVYLCHGLLGEDMELNYNYIIDVLSNSPQHEIKEEIRKDKAKSLTAEKILFSKINEMNLQFRESNKSDYNRLRDEGVLMNVFSSWSNWESCNGCLKIRKRKRKCYIRPVLISNETKTLSRGRLRNSTIQELSTAQKKEKLFLLSYNFACRSLQLAQIFPDVAEDLENIPDYYKIEPCYAPCLKSRSKEGDPKYENIFIIDQGGSATFICPESTYNDNVVWKKGRSTIEPVRKDPHIQVDMFATLYLRSVTDKQSGNYTCFINSEPIQRINVVVLTKSIFQTEEFHNHCQYLGIILIISFFLYIIGVISACTQKKRFKTINLKRENYSKLNTINKSNDIF